MNSSRSPCSSAEDAPELLSADPHRSLRRADRAVAPAAGRSPFDWRRELAEEICALFAAQARAAKENRDPAAGDRREEGAPVDDAADPRVARLTPLRASLLDLEEFGETLGAREHLLQDEGDEAESRDGTPGPARCVPALRLVPAGIGRLDLRIPLRR